MYAYAYTFIYTRTRIFSSIAKFSGYLFPLTVGPLTPFSSTVRYSSMVGRRRAHLNMMSLWVTMISWESWKHDIAISRVNTVDCHFFFFFFLHYRS